MPEAESNMIPQSRQSRIIDAPMSKRYANSEFDDAGRIIAPAQAPPRAPLHAEDITR
jgi:hypothetical protein